jgi:hypothetical protein
MGGTTGWFGLGQLRCDRRCVRMFRAVGIPAIAALLVLAPAAAANSTSYIWSGRSTVSSNWSAEANWEGVSPTDSIEAGLLEFPHLTSETCSSEIPTRTCYLSYNNLSGLSAEALQIDDGDDYLLAGEEVGIGSGGLVASPAGGSVGSAGDVVELPIHLSATQTWKVAGRSAGGTVGENGLLLAGRLSGSSELTINVDDGPAIYLAENETEVGPVNIDGTEASKYGVSNGFLALLGADLNSSDGQAVNVSHVLVLGSGAVGPLTTEAAELSVGNGDEPAGGIEAAAVDLDSASIVSFEIVSAGTSAKQGYSQLASRGATELGGAAIEVVVRPPSETEPCPTLTPGETYTFVSTSGPLSGSFSNAPEGGMEIPIRFGVACPPHSQKMRIEYHRSGTTHTVTGTVEEEAFNKQQETNGKEEEVKSKEEAKRKEEAAKQQEDELERHAEESSTRMVEAAAAAAMKEREEVASLAAASTATQGVAAFQAHASAPVPDALLSDTALQVSPSGVFTAQISCPAGETECAGTVTFRSFNAIRTSARSKPAILALASGSFTIRGGAVKAITLHLSSAARTLLSRLHLLKARATLLAHDAAGVTHSSRATVDLGLVKTKHGRG